MVLQPRDGGKARHPFRFLRHHDYAALDKRGGPPRPTTLDTEDPSAEEAPRSLTHLPGSVKSVRLMRSTYHFGGIQTANDLSVIRGWCTT